MNTSIEDLLSIFDPSHDEMDEKVEDEKVEDENLLDRIFDFSLSQEDRIDAFNRFYRDEPQQLEDVVCKINCIYNISPLSLIREFIREIIMNSDLDMKLRIDCAYTLMCSDIERSQEIGMQCLDVLIDIIEDPSSSIPPIPVPCRLQYILDIIKTGKYDKHINTLYNFINDKNIDEVYRYRTILRLEHQLMIDCCHQFITGGNSVQYSILACQNVLSKSEEKESSIENVLTDFMNDDTLTQRQRADAADVLIHNGGIESVKSAMEVIKMLGGENAVSIYENTENVHMHDIDLEFINNFKLKCPLPDLDFVKKYILRISERLEKHQIEKIEISLLRIELDRTTFHSEGTTGISHSLQTILIRIFAYIQEQENQLKTELEKRLLEELIDMSGTCTTGFMGRLVNTLSGFGEYSLKISWEDQIKSNLHGRLNSRILNEEKMEDILEQMTNIKLKDRSEYLEFFARNISSIREEMYQEFREYMSDTDWDLYFRKALIHYEKLG
jgi:hypothetical protein